MAYYNQQKRYNSYKNTKTLNKVDKEKKITEAMDRKEKSIRDFAKNKDVGIAISSAQRDGFAWCINHPDWKKDMTDQDRMDWIDKTIKEILSHTAQQRNELVEIYADAVEGNTKQGVVEPVEQEIEID